MFGHPSWLARSQLGCNVIGRRAHEPSAMPRLIVLTTLAMLAFAGNSLLCRVALRDTAIDAASFTSIRLASGALMLIVLLRARGVRPSSGGSWPMAAMLFAYAALFSFPHRGPPAAAGAPP